jgi:hypothetical protein
MAAIIPFFKRKAMSGCLLYTGSALFDVSFWHGSVLHARLDPSRSEIGGSTTLFLRIEANQHGCVRECGEGGRGAVALRYGIPYYPRPRPRPSRNSCQAR